MDLNERIQGSEVAQLLGVTRTRVSDMVADGILHAEGKPRKFVLKDAVQDYVSYLRNRADKSKQSEKDVDKKKAIADAEYKAAKAEQEKLELAELEGNMHRTEDVQAMLEQLVYGTRSMLMALPGRTAIDVVGAANAAEAADIIRKQVNEVLNALSQYEFDPEFFADRVRDRKGWRTVVDDLSEPADSKPKRGRPKGDKGVQGAGKPAGK